MDKYLTLIVTSLIMGTLARVLMMKVDYRQYPTYPQAYLSHFTLGIIASALGAVALPSIIEKEFVAVTFLALAAQQFRDVRNMERQSLDNIEVTELVPRGTAYIEDIAKAFEARNYIAILTSLISSIGVYFGVHFKFHWITQILLGVIFGTALYLALSNMLKGRAIEDIAHVKAAKITFDGPLLTVAGVPVMNIGLKDSRKIFLESGIAVEIIPKNPYAVTILANIGQRQSIQHNAATQLGIRKDLDEPDFTPIARRNPENGNVVMALITMKSDTDSLVEVVKRSPVLESAKRKPVDAFVTRNRG
ncbi:hypothetical protein F8154_01330 [Alkaliphilus pronyensis]|uniref:YIEGIA protein n=1 Tax=Alkaliphilus pronyensis TaxID=1482732 RepID=A0A6I0FDZ1_9FIRM|nr:YIEGIA family protein [Alkaliphilus pronyensis]KAB3538562.1 hypothetical protein F8154_01330 [Alkaliphilus pronyensis]